MTQTDRSRVSKNITKVHYDKYLYKILKPKYLGDQVKKVNNFTNSEKMKTNIQFFA